MKIIYKKPDFSFFLTIVVHGIIFSFCSPSYPIQLIPIDYSLLVLYTFFFVFLYTYTTQSLLHLYHGVAYFHFILSMLFILHGLLYSLLCFFPVLIVSRRLSPQLRGPFKQTVIFLTFFLSWQYAPFKKSFNFNVL